jgi:rhamnulokinase
MFIAPDDMLTAVEEYLRKTQQSIPDDAGLARATLESLALRYRECLHGLESLIGYSIETIHIVGGGVQNKFLCQMTADACNRRVVAGPVEATALGNVAAQCVAMGRFSSIVEVRNWMRSMPDIQNYEPKDSDAWIEAASRLKEIATR